MSFSFRFWYKWLLIVSILLTLTGLVIGLCPNFFLFEFHTASIVETFFNGNLSEEANKLRSFFYAPIGGTIAGYFLLQSFIVWKPFYNKELWSWYAISGALLLWFTVDSGLSIYHGAFFNVWMVNIWTLILVGLPLLMTRHEFKKTNDPQS